MECAAKGRGSPCVGRPTRHCDRCNAVAYCSISHQVEHWIAHKEECARLEEQMTRVHILYNLPFTFSEEATTQLLERKVTRCSFLMQRNFHLLGMWKYECNCGTSVAFSDYLRINDEWWLPNLMCPCQEPLNPLTMCLSSWKSYYEWRHLPLNSPVAMLLHWPLTIYHAIQLAAKFNSLSEISDELHIHYLGPQRELCQLPVFQELHALFPGLQVHVDFIGPDVPRLRDGEKMTIRSYAKCLEIDCSCKSGAENSSGGPSGKSLGVTLHFHKGFYHDHCRDLLKNSVPHLIFAPNAGVAAYPSWVPTIELLKDLNVPVIFSDYCEEAAHLAASCISTVIGRPLSFPIQLNPFRHPMVVEDSSLCLPCHSNGFLFGI